MARDWRLPASQNWHCSSSSTDTTAEWSLPSTPISHSLLAAHYDVTNYLWVDDGDRIGEKYTLLTDACDNGNGSHESVPTTHDSKFTILEDSYQGQAASATPCVQDSYYPFNNTPANSVLQSIHSDDNDGNIAIFSGHGATHTGMAYPWPSYSLPRLANNNVETYDVFDVRGTTQLKNVKQVLACQGTSPTDQQPQLADWLQAPLTNHPLLSGVGEFDCYPPKEMEPTNDPAEVMFDPTADDDHPWLPSYGAFALQGGIPTQNAQTHMSDGHPQKTDDSEPVQGHRDRDCVSVTGMNRDKSKDEFLLECKAAGMSYKEIKARGGFEEAESTLRGRYRSLTKPKEARVRKPEWKRKDVEMLKQVVAQQLRALQFGSSTHNTRPRNSGGRVSLRLLDKIPWKVVAKTMSDRGCYQYGNATVKKKYLDIMGLS